MLGEHDFRADSQQVVEGVIAHEPLVGTMRPGNRPGRSKLGHYMNSIA
jgi:hypothetical protein